MRFLATVLALLMLAFPAAATHQTAPTVPKFYFEGADKPYPIMKENRYFLIGDSYPVEASYLLRRNGKIGSAATITIIYSIENLAGTPDWQAADCKLPSRVNTGEVGIMLRRSTDATKEFHRFWSTTRINLEPGQYVLTARTAELDKWISVQGRSAIFDPGKFKDLLSNVRDIAVTFGGCGNYGHGVKVRGGNARFTILSATVQ